MRTLRRFLLGALASALTLTASAEDRREIRAVRTPTPPRIDGNVSDEVWSLAPPITGLEQQRPDNGQPSSEEITVHLLYDDEALYVGADMPQRNSPVIRLLARRDTFLDSDWFGILIDSQHDHRTALGFFVNPEGVQLDEAVTNDWDEDYDWDGVWQSAAVVRGGGWSAEIRIPLSQLRFVARDQQVWGVNFIRWVRARQEQARLVSHPRNARGFVSHFGDLTGIDGIRPRAKFEVQPYTTSSALRDATVVYPDPLSQRSRSEAEAGADLRWTTRSSVTVKATVNPDFGQVEVDPAILNLSEFELFFPEKRPFFVEGAKLFTFGGLATEYSSPFRVSHPLLFYSRRVGREPQVAVSGNFVEVPSSTRILGAAKVTGRTAGGTTVSVIDALTDETSARIWDAGKVRESVVQPLANYFAGRITRDFGESARIGALFTSVARDTVPEGSLLAAHVTAAGIDGYSLFQGGSVLLDWMIAGSEASGSAAAIRALQSAPARYFQRPDSASLELDPSRTSLEGWGAKAILSRETGTWRYQAGLQSWSPGFDLNEAGFHSRSDLTAAHAQLTWYDVALRKRSRNNRLTVGWYGSRNGDRDVLSNGITAQFANTFVNWWTSSATFSRAAPGFDDRETRGGPVIEKPSGWSSQLRLASNTAKRFWFDLGRNDASDHDGGSTALTQLTVGTRPRSNITLELDFTHATVVTASKFFTSVRDDAAPAGDRRYLFGRLREQRLEIAPRVDWTVRRTLTLQLFLQPLAASGSYERIGELDRSHGSYHPYEDIVHSGSGYAIDPDGSGPSEGFTVGNPDFTFRSLRANAVLRWEVGPATLFAVWNQGREARLLEPAPERVEGLRSIRKVPAVDRFLLKVSYRFDLPK